MAASGIAAGVRVPQVNALGGSNPLEIIKTAFDLRNMQQQYEANLEAGQTLATSKDWNEAITRLGRSPNAAWQIPMINQLREGLRTQADIARLGAETQRTQFNTDTDRMNYAISTSTDPEDLARRVAGVPGLNNPTLAQDVLTSLTHGNPDSAELERRKAALLIGTGKSTQEAYGAGGSVAPQVIQGPYGPGGAQQPRIVGGVGGVGVGGPPTGITPGEQRTQETRATELSEYKGRLETSVENGSNLMASVSEAKEALERFKAQPGQSSYRHLAELASTLGAPQDVVNAIVHGDLAAVQEFEKLAASQAMTQLDLFLPQGSRANIREWEAFRASNPNIDMLPGAINKIYDFWARSHVKNRIELNALNDYQAKGGDMERWRSKWQSELGRRGLLSPSFRGKDGTIDPRAVLHLIDHPETAAMFDREYGPGLSKKYLGTD